MNEVDLIVLITVIILLGLVIYFGIIKDGAKNNTCKGCSYNRTNGAKLVREYNKKYKEVSNESNILKNE